MTRKGYEKLMAELVELRSTGRAEISRQLEEARSFGDLSENAEYAAANPDEEWIVGGGWAMECFPGGLPSKEDLDRALIARPPALGPRTGQQGTQGH